MLSRGIFSEVEGSIKSWAPKQVAQDSETVLMPNIIMLDIVYEMTPETKCKIYGLATNIRSICTREMLMQLVALW